MAAMMTMIAVLRPDVHHHDYGKMILSSAKTKAPSTMSKAPCTMIQSPLPMLKVPLLML